MPSSCSGFPVGVGMGQVVGYLLYLPFWKASLPWRQARIIL